MAELTFGLAMAIGGQGTLGTPDPTIAGLTGSIDSDDGIVLGDPGGGAGETGIELELTRRLTELAAVSGSFTRQPSTFLGVDVATLRFSWQLKGNGLTQDASLTDTDYAPIPGIDALLRACGFTGAAWGGGAGWIYTPASASIATAKIWSGVGANAIAIVIKDIVGSLEIEFTPGEVAIATATLSGVLHSITSGVTLPTFNYGAGATTGNQLVSAPAISAVGHNWGISAALRGFTDATLSIDNEIEELPDSNAEGGVRKRQTGRVIDLSMTLLADSGDADFELTQLQLATAPTDALNFTVGTPATNGLVIKGYRVIGTNPEVRNVTPTRIGASAGAELELALVDDAANGEFSLIFL